MGGKAPKYEAPAPDPSIQAYNYYMMDRQKTLDAKADADALEAASSTNAIKSTGQAGYNAFKQNVLNQYNAGLLTAEKAQQNFKDYEDRYKLGTGFTQADLNELSNQATQQASGARRALAGQTYKDLYGRDAREDELASFERMQIESKGAYGLSDLVNTIKASKEYTSSLNDNYLASYYDTMYGKQETTKSPEGYEVKTGKRTFNYNSAFDPKFAGDLTASTGISTSEVPTSFTGTAAEIETFQEAQRQKRDFMYNAGLTNLQGQIDKDTQKIKNEGTKDVTRIASQGQLLSNLTSGFWS